MILFVDAPGSYSCVYVIQLPVHSNMTSDEKEKHFTHKTAYNYTQWGVIFSDLKQTGVTT